MKLTVKEAVENWTKLHYLIYLYICIGKSDYSLIDVEIEEIFEKLIPFSFEAKVRMLFLESYVSEHMARMNAMHQATKNASEMIDDLVLVRNKIRQAIITKEIIEIVSGSQALKK